MTDNPETTNDIETLRWLAKLAAERSMDLEAQLAAIDKHSAEQEDEVEFLKAANQRLEAQLAETSESLRKLNQDQAEEIAKLNEMLVARDSHMDVIREQRDRRDIKVRDLEAMETKLRKALADKQIEIDTTLEALRRQAQESGDRLQTISKLEGMVKGRDQTIEHLKSEVKSRDIRITAMGNQIEAQRDTIRREEREGKEATNVLLSHGRTIERLRGKLRSIRLILDGEPVSIGRVENIANEITPEFRSVREVEGD